MLDTVKLRSPALDEASARAVEHSCQRRQCIEIATGELVYEITTGALAGSWDERVSIRVMREEWFVPDEGRAAVTRPCEPYVLLEGSVHKALLGHNVHGGPVEPVAACRWLVSDVAGRLDVPLPDGALWTVQRVDWTEVYDLGSYEAVEEYLHALRLAEMPRRRPHTYPHGVYFPGHTTTAKLYHKGPEFHRHDRKRLKEILGIRSTAELYARANNLLRFEVELHSRKLDEDFRKGGNLQAGKPTVAWLTRQYLESVHDREAGRLLREGQADMHTVRTNRAVARRLQDVYGQRLGNQLFGTWLQLAALGEEVVKGAMKRPTFYRHRKQLVDAGCSWKGADVRVIAQVSAIPDGFSPVRRDPRRLTEEVPQVVQRLEPFRIAA
jgi:II/X family phage/plasmid replication protein